MPSACKQQEPTTILQTGLSLVNTRPQEFLNPPKGCRGCRASPNGVITWLSHLTLNCSAMSPCLQAAGAQHHHAALPHAGQHCASTARGPGCAGRQPDPRGPHQGLPLPGHHLGPAGRAASQPHAGQMVVFSVVPLNRRHKNTAVSGHSSSQHIALAEWPAD